MNDQLVLAPVHNNDPVESLEAAMKVNAKRQLELVLAVLYRAERPLTDDEIGERAGLLRNSAATRRGIARNMGLVEKVGRALTPPPRQNPCSTWRLTDEGRKVAAQVAA